MLKPVAYINHMPDGKIVYSAQVDTRSAWSMPLYEKSQLEPKVQMTPEEFDEWQQLDLNVNAFGLLSQLLEDVTDPTFENLTHRIYGTDDNSDTQKQIELCQLLLRYNPDFPEGTIAIVEEKKWFVENIDDDSEYRFLKVELDNKLFSNKSLKQQATYFDTKEEAKVWENPLTEAVLLPLEKKH